MLRRHAELQRAKLGDIERVRRFGEENGFPVLPWPGFAYQPELVAEARLVAGQGIEGDRYLLGAGLFLLVLGLLIANGYEFLMSGKYWISVYPGVALLLTGGGPMGVGATAGVVRFLEERQVGYDWGVPNIRIPIVVGAVMSSSPVAIVVGPPPSSPVAIVVGRSKMAAPPRRTTLPATHVPRWLAAARVFDICSTGTKIDRSQRVIGDRLSVISDRASDAPGTIPMTSAAAETATHADSRGASGSGGRRAVAPASSAARQSHDASSRRCARSRWLSATAAASGGVDGNAVANGKAGDVGSDFGDDTGGVAA